MSRLSVNQDHIFTTLERFLQKHVSVLSFIFLCLNGTQAQQSQPAEPSQSDRVALPSIRRCRVLQLRIESRWNLRCDLIKKRSAAQWRKREAFTSSYWALRLDAVACWILSIEGRQSGAQKPNFDGYISSLELPNRLHIICRRSCWVEVQIRVTVVTFRVSEGLHVPAKVWTFPTGSGWECGTWNNSLETCSQLSSHRSEDWNDNNNCEYQHAAAPGRSVVLRERRSSYWSY